jgi:Domain of unknown function (DUF4389)
VQPVSYPVTFEADYVERRSRLTAFFRLILAIPLYIWLWLYGIVATIAIVAAWFAIVFTARYPRALYDFVEGYNRYFARITAYAALVCDPYPSFLGEDDPAYPVRMQFEGPLDPYSRLKTLFRIILAIPIVIIRYVIGLLLEITAIAAWVVIVITGKLPRGLFDVMVLANSYTARSDAYLYLLTETWPPFQDAHTRSAGIPGSGPTPERPAPPAAGGPAPPAPGGPAPPAPGGPAPPSPEGPAPA